MSWFLSKHDVRQVVREELQLVEEQIINILMANQTELAAELKALKTQVDKVAKEQGDRFDMLTAKIAELERTIQQGEVTPEVTAALAEVKTALDALDATIPDAPPPPA